MVPPVSMVCDLFGCVQQTSGWRIESVLREQCFTSGRILLSEQAFTTSDFIRSLTGRLKDTAYMYSNIKIP